MQIDKKRDYLKKLMHYNAEINDSVRDSNVFIFTKKALSISAYTLSKKSSNPNFLSICPLFIL